MRTALPLAVLVSVSCVLSAQVLPGDIAISGLSTTSFGIASGPVIGSTPPNATIYDTGSFGGVGFSYAILRDPAAINEFIIGGNGFIGRATITGPGTVTYATITTDPGLGTAAQLSWDNSGNLIVADSGLDIVQMVTPGGTVVPLSGSGQLWGPSLYSGAYEPATGDVIVGGNNALFRLPNGSPNAVTIAISLGGPVTAIDFDPCNGDILATVMNTGRLVRVDSLGNVTDEIPPGTVGSPTGLTIDERGNYLISQGSKVWRVPPGGGPVAVADSFGIGTLSDVAYVSGRSCAFGAACPAPFGNPTLSVDGPFVAGTTLTTRSIHHNPGAIGMLVIGFTPVAPPLPLDLLLGTSGGCLLHANTDFLVLGITDATGDFVHSLNTNPAFANRRLIMQHAVFEGGSFASSSFSNGLEVAF